MIPVLLHIQNTKLQWPPGSGLNATGDVLMPLDELQAKLAARDATDAAALSASTIKCNVPDKQKMTCFNMQARGKLTVMNTDDQKKSVILQIIDIFDKEFQLPDKPGFIASAAKREKYSQAAMGGNMYFGLMNELLKNPPDEQKYIIINELEVVYNGYKSSQEKKGLKEIVQGIGDAFKFITSGKTPEADASLKYTMNIDPNLAYSEYTTSGGIGISDILSLVGLGYLVDAVKQ